MGLNLKLCFNKQTIPDTIPNPEYNCRLWNGQIRNIQRRIMRLEREIKHLQENLADHKKDFEDWRAAFIDYLKARHPAIGGEEIAQKVDRLFELRHVMEPVVQAKGKDAKEKIVRERKEFCALVSELTSGMGRREIKEFTSKLGRYLKEMDTDLLYMEESKEDIEIRQEHMHAALQGMEILKLRLEALERQEEFNGNGRQKLLFPPGQLGLSE